MRRLRILTCCSVVLAFIVHAFRTQQPITVAAGTGLVLKKEWLAINKAPLTPKEDRRPPDQTFLTFPEWFLVFSPEEQANYFKQHTSSTFPFMQHTAQIWSSYRVVNDQIKDNFPVNKGYHFMIWVIGSSASAEYAIKAWYESIIGRITDTHEVITDEDKFNAVFTQDYVDFIKDRPWYEFDFKTRLQTLWTSTAFAGPHLLRKIERKYILSSELLVKWGYGKLIGLGTKTVYDDALPTTAVLIDATSGHTAIPGAMNYTNNTQLILLPRYDKFSGAVMQLAKAGHQIREIAGNNAAILLTILVKATDKVPVTDAKIIFTQPLPASAGLQRIALAIPVPKLSHLLVQLDEAGIKVEHVFDY